MRRAIVALALVAAVVAVPAAGAQAGAGVGATVTIVQGIDYNAGNGFELTVCIDDSSIQDNVPSATILDPINLTAGDHYIAFVQGTDCLADPFADANFSVADGDDITLMSYSGESDGVAVLANDTSCVEPGQTRVTFRNAAYTPDGADAFMTPQAGADVQIADAVNTGEQQVNNIAAGTYTDANAVSPVDQSPITSLGNPGVVPEGGIAYVYIYAGGDGDVGYFVDRTMGTLCQQPTTTTTEATTTTAAAAAAVVTPRFTG